MRLRWGCFNAAPGEGLLDGIKWVIAGAETGPNARPPHPQWFRDVRDQCVAAGVPFFFKGFGDWTVKPESNVVKPDMAGQLLPFTSVCASHKRDEGKRHWNAYPPHPQDGIGSFEVLSRRHPQTPTIRTLDGQTWEQFPFVPVSEGRRTC